ncbi:MAG: SEC-C domain-containing protein, partial [Campylobacterales bacterium]|nr:SEC-C domain-containing protein [Campylobacterales bacterium]
NVYFSLNIDELKELEFNDLKDKILSDIKSVYEEKFSKLQNEQRNEIERIIYLQVLDGAWRDHLYQMDILKAGISLRSYNQKDPLVEYKKEAYNLFMELVRRIKHDTVETLSAIQFKTEQEQKEQVAFEKLARQLEDEQNKNLRFNHQENSEVVINKKANRNDPCPCGSGLKYKNCCGKSGPKKGLIANS